MSYKVYKYTNTVNGKVYIGQTSQTLAERAQSNGTNYRESPLFYNAITKYGWHSFKGEVLVDDLTVEEANMLEEFYIRLYNSTDRDVGYNLSAGGYNREMNEASKKLISQKAKERYADKTKNPMYGRKHSPESIAKMSEIKRGDKNPMYGTTWSEERRSKGSAPRKRPNLTEEARRAISQRFVELGKQNAKPIRCIEDDLVFPSLYATAEHYHVHTSSLCGQLRGRQHTCAGKHFEYVA